MTEPSAWMPDPLPPGWRVVPLRYLCDIGTGSADTVESEPEGLYPFVVRSPKLQRIDRYTHDGEAILTPGDGDVGEIFHHLDGRFAVHQRVYALTDFREVTPRFLYYAFGATFRNVTAAGTAKSTVESLRRPILTSFPVAVPPLGAQARIADFLDRETAEIDAMIGKQEELVGLLGERRSAVIAHAVTKGLNPNAPMKDSGIEWLGDVPAHWRVSRFRLEVEVNGGQVDPRDTPWSDMLLIAPNHVESDTGRILGYETAQDQGADSGKYVAREGQIIYSKIRPALNKVCIAPMDCLCSADMYAISSLKGDNHRFLMYYMLAKPFHWFATQMSMRVKMPKVNRDELGDAPWVRPPIAEQRAIAEHLDQLTADIDATVEKARESIELMRERRAALISDAVTGRLDLDTYGRVEREGVA